MLTRFLIYGLVGLLAEILWTGAHSLIKRDFTLKSETSVWMFFIYGSVILFEPLIHLTQTFPLLLRGTIYALCIFTIEYLTGFLMKKLNICPWDYSNAKFNINGIIRLDYAPAWFVLGLSFEFIYIQIL